MKIETLKERIAKNEVKIEKKAALIIKKEAQIEKKAAKIMKKYDVDVNTINMTWPEIKETFGDDAGNEIFWTMCDIKHLREDLERIPGEIEEIKQTKEKQERQLAGELEKEAMFINEVPEAMKELEKALVEKWNEWDFARRERLQEKYNELGYAAFINEFSGADYFFKSMTDEEITKNNEKEARREILDLLNRVKEVTGEVTNWRGIHLTAGNDNIPVLNGMVEGKEGRAMVESIIAGGYNIQRLHIRTLVKEM